MNELTITYSNRQVVLQPGQAALIGRREDSTLVVGDPRVSREHVRLSWGAQGWMLENLGRAGTFMSGQPVTRSCLVDPVEVRLAAVDGPTVRLDPAAAAAASPAAALGRPAAPEPAAGAGAPRGGVCPPGPADAGAAPQAPPTGAHAAGPGYPGVAPQAPSARLRRRRRGPLITVITLIVLVVLLVVSDRVANAVAENQMASRMQSSLGLSGKPHVTIEGFPFWTQLIARDFHTVDITASNETVTASSAGGGLLEIASLNATLHGMHIHGANSATIDQFNASALITFTALGSAGGIPSGITLSADGPNQVKATVNVAGLFSDSAVARVSPSGSNGIHVQVVDAGGIPTSVLGNLANFTIRIPKLPAGVSIQSVSVTQQGVRITATGQNTTLSQ